MKKLFIALISLLFLVSLPLFTSVSHDKQANEYYDCVVKSYNKIRPIELKAKYLKTLDYTIVYPRFLIEEKGFKTICSDKEFDLGTVNFVKDNEVLEDVQTCVFDVKFVGITVLTEEGVCQFTMKKKARN
jgi:hypothetical protein